MAKARDSGSLDSFNYVQALKHASARAGGAPPRPRARAAAPAAAADAADAGAQAETEQTQAAGAGGAAAKARAKIPAARTAMPAKRLVVCYACGYSHTVAGQLRIPYCPKCKAILNASDLTIDAKRDEDAFTIGDVAILPGAEFGAGLKVAGKVVKVGADVSALAKLTATEALVLLAGAKMDGVKVENFSGKTIVPADETVKVEGAFACTELEVRGELRANAEVERAATLRAGSTFSGSFTGPTLIVEDGAAIRAEARIGRQAAV